jgi:uncharacterized surface protein with fasciclin (FAS1) repeats
MKKYVTKELLALVVSIVLITSCKKEQSKEDVQLQRPAEEATLAEAHQAVNEKAATVADFEKIYNSAAATVAARTNKNVLELLQQPCFFKIFTAAVIKTGLTQTLSASTLNATLFAPTDAAFSKLPPPYNHAETISRISDPDSIYALRNIILYHLMGTQKFRHQFPSGRSSAISLKPEEGLNDNLLYFSNSFGLMLLNGKSLVLLSNLRASNGVVHIVDDVLIPPAETIAQVLMTYPEYTTFFSALIKAELFGTLTGPGNFTVFAPTNAAFSKLPAPFNNAANIENISDSAQIATLTNIVQYHLSESRYFAWDMGHYNQIVTMGAAPNNKVTGLMGLNRGWVKGNRNNSFSKITPANIFTSNGVMQVIDQVLKP